MRPWSHRAVRTSNTWRCAATLRASAFASHLSVRDRGRHRDAPVRPGCELVDGRRFPSFGAAEHETLAWIGFYNHERLHEELGDVPPAEFEERAASADRSTPNGPFGPAEPDRPALVGGAPVGLGSSVESS